MSHYDVIDGLILDAVKRGSSTLYADFVEREADRISRATGRETMRIIDGRIQSLRKSGRIAYVSGAWQVQS